MCVGDLKIYLCVFDYGMYTEYVYTIFIVRKNLLMKMLTLKKMTTTTIQLGGSIVLGRIVVEGADPQ